MQGRLQWSPDGSKILFTYLTENRTTPVNVVEADGSRLWSIEDVPGDLVSGYHGPLRYFDVSPDGSRIVYSTCAYPDRYNERPHDDGDYEIVVSNVDGTDTMKLTEDDRFDNYPVWSPDGTRVAFIDVSDVTHVKIYTVATQGTTLVTISERRSAFQIPRDAVVWHPPSWSPDGRRIAFLAYNIDTADGGGSTFRNSTAFRSGVELDVYTVGASGSNLKRIVSNVVSAPSWSPDGERIAVAVPEEEDDAALYTFATDGSDPVRVASIGHNDLIDRRRSESDPHALWVPNVAWSPDGSKIMYGALAVVNADDGSVVLDSLPFMFKWTYLTRRNPTYEPSEDRPLAAWSPDGSRIAVRDVADRVGLGKPFLYTTNSDGTDLRILVWGRPVWEGGGSAPTTTPPYLLLPMPPAEIRECSDGAVVPDPEENPGLVKDCRTLLGMRDTLAGSGTLLWSSDTPITRREWVGVHVGGDPLRVYSLSLSGPPALDLYGHIPPEIGNLDRLTELVLSGNNLNGRIPPEIGNLINLYRLTLASTHLIGSIPPEIGNLTNLHELDLRSSQLSGTIPAELGKLTNLQQLYLGGNELTGCIPQALRNVERNDLDELGLDYCE